MQQIDPTSRAHRLYGRGRGLPLLATRSCSATPLSPISTNREVVQRGPLQESAVATHHSCSLAAASRSPSPVGAGLSATALAAAASPLGDDAPPACSAGVPAPSLPPPASGVARPARGSRSSSSARSADGAAASGAGARLGRDGLLRHRAAGAGALAAMGDLPVVPPGLRRDADRMVHRRGRAPALDGLRTAPHCRCGDAVPDLSPCLRTTSQHVASTLPRRPWTTHSTRPQHRPWEPDPVSRTVSLC